MNYHDPPGLPYISACCLMSGARDHGVHTLYLSMWWSTKLKSHHVTL